MKLSAWFRKTLSPFTAGAGRAVRSSRPFFLITLLSRPGVWIDALILFGAGSIFRGVHDIHPPSAYIAIGLISLALGIAAARRSK